MLGRKKKRVTGRAVCYLCLDEVLEPTGIVCVIVRYASGSTSGGGFQESQGEGQLLLLAKQVEWVVE